MLVCTRDVDQTFIITGPDGTEIMVMLVEVKTTHSAKIGIQAPSDWNIRRGELPPRNQPHRVPELGDIKPAHLEQED